MHQLVYKVFSVPRRRMNGVEPPSKTQTMSSVLAANGAIPIYPSLCFEKQKRSKAVLARVVINLFLSLMFDGGIAEINIKWTPDQEQDKDGSRESTISRCPLNNVKTVLRVVEKKAPGFLHREREKKKGELRKRKMKSEREQ